MLGFRRPNSGDDERSVSSQTEDIAKLLFDTFSKRLGSFETALKLLATDVEKLKSSGDQSKLSDIVLLERLQRTEKLLGESLTWIKELADAFLRPPTHILPPESSGRIIVGPPLANSPAEARPITALPVPNDPSIVRPGLLNSITTPTELQVLTLLANEGPKSAPEIGRFVGRSREHTARLMKKLFDEGYVRRDPTRIPFRYSTVERVKSSFTKQSQKDQGQEVASPPQA